MPELPEVEALAGFLREHAAGRFVARIDLAAVAALKTVDPPMGALAGSRVEDAVRHGKFLDVAVGGVHLVTHLARAGWLHWREQMPAGPLRPGRGPVALRVEFAGGGGFDLTEAGTQKRLAVWLVGRPEQVSGISRLGPDALTLSHAALAEALARAGGSRLKSALTDQSLIAGVGNAYSDEILWEARLSPYAVAGTLPAPAVAALHAALRDVLEAAVQRARAVGAAQLKAEKREGMAVHGRTGAPCPRCTSPIREVSFAERSLQYCATCQTGGRILADRRLSRLLR